MFKTVNDGKLPTRGSKYSACVDVYANEDCVIGAGETAVIGLGIAIDLRKLFYLMPEYIKIAKDIEKDLVNGVDVRNRLFEETGEFTDNFMKSHYISLKPRSSLRAKGLISHSGVVDLDYKDEIKIIIHNPMKLGFISNFINSALSMCGLQKLYKPQDNGRYDIKKGKRIGQLLLLEHKSYLFGIESEEKRTGGFGSTGSN